MLTQLTVQQYTKTLSSSQPTPGGGSALANIASQGVALLLMSCNVTIDKLTRLNKAVPHELTKLVEQLTPYMAQLLQLVDDDAKCFDNILCAMRLPKDTPQDKQYRTQQLQSAYITSACTCLQLTTICLHCFALADIAIALADKYVVSDAHIGKDILKMCTTNSTHNIYANTDYIADKVIANKIVCDTKQLLSQLD